MNSREIRAIITADPTGFVKGTKTATTSSTNLEKILKRLGPVGSGIQGVIDKLGLSGVSSAIGLASIPAALGATFAVANKAVDSYVALGEKVRDYSVITGQSAEASSRQVQAFAELGVGEDAAASSMVKLSKAIETTPKKLAALGIEIVKDAKGNVDLGATLLSVAAAWQSTTDAAKRNEIALTAFGKGGAAMIPILEANAAELTNLEKRVNTIYTAEDLQRVRDYKLAQQENQRASEDFWNWLGGKLLPAWEENTQNINENIYVNEHLDEQLKKMGATQSQNRIAIIEADKALRSEYQSSLDAQKAADGLAQNQQAAADAAKAEADAENALYDALNKVTDTTDALTDATFALKDSQNRVRDAIDAYNLAVREHGKNSREARDALLALQEAQQGEQEAYRKVAEAALAKAEAEATANNTSLDAYQKAQIQIGAYRDLEKGLNKTSPLYKALEAYIAELEKIPKDVSTTVGFSTQRSVTAGGSTSTRGGTKSFDSGGMVPGPEGAPMDATVHGGEMVLTPGQQAALGGGRVAPVVNVHIGTYIGDARELSKLLAHEIRMSGGLR